MTRLLVGAIAVAGSLLLAGCASTSAPEPGRTAAAGTSTAPAGVTTRGTGTVTIAPDTLTVVLAVQTRAASAADALSDDNTRTAALLGVVRSRGVADKDLRTSDLAIVPTTDPEGRVTGYEVSNEVTATLHDLAGAGALVDAAARSAGDAVRVRQIGFSAGDPADAQARARADAVTQAVAQAHQLADAAHTTLGPVLSITEVTDAGPPLPTRDSTAAAASAVPIEPGTQDVTVTVEVVHALR